MWWGTGGNSASHSNKLNSTNLFRLPKVAAPAVEAEAAVETAVEAAVEAAPTPAVTKSAPPVKTKADNKYPAGIPEIVIETFQYADKDGNGSLDQKELCSLFALIDVELEGTEMDELMRQCDTTGDGLINMKEFVQLYNIVEGKEELHGLGPEDVATYRKFCDIHGQCDSDMILATLKKLDEVNGLEIFTKEIVYNFGKDIWKKNNAHIIHIQDWGHMLFQICDIAQTFGLQTVNQRVAHL